MNTSPGKIGSPAFDTIEMSGRTDIIAMDVQARTF